MIGAKAENSAADNLTLSVEILARLRIEEQREEQRYRLRVESRISKLEVLMWIAIILAGLAYVWWFIPGGVR